MAERGKKKPQPSPEELGFWRSLAAGDLSQFSPAENVLGSVPGLQAIAEWDVNTYETLKGWEEQVNDFFRRPKTQQEREAGPGRGQPSIPGALGGQPGRDQGPVRPPGQPLTATLPGSGAVGAPAAGPGPAAPSGGGLPPLTNFGPVRELFAQSAPQTTPQEEIDQTHISALLSGLGAGVSRAAGADNLAQTFLALGGGALQGFGKGQALEVGTQQNDRARMQDYARQKAELELDLMQAEAQQQATRARAAAVASRARQSHALRMWKMKQPKVSFRDGVLMAQYTDPQTGQVTVRADDSIARELARAGELSEAVGGDAVTLNEIVNSRLRLMNPEDPMYGAAVGLASVIGSGRSPYDMVKPETLQEWGAEIQADPLTSTYSGQAKERYVNERLHQRLLGELAASPEFLEDLLTGGTDG